MIHQVLPIIVGELNEYLKRSLDVQEDRVILSAIIGPTGGLAFAGENQVICMVTAIEKEEMRANPTTPYHLKRNAPLYLNLNLLFAAYFPDNYLEGLRFISLVLAFFQGKQVFSHQNTPGLPPEAVKLTGEIIHLDQQTQQQMWSTIGANLMPSVNLKLRMIEITGPYQLPEVSVVRGEGEPPVSGPAER